MITNIRYDDDFNGKLQAIIDDQTIDFDIKKIIKKYTYISNKRTINTVLQEPIKIQMQLYAFYIDDVFTNNDIKVIDEVNNNMLGVELIEQGNVLLTIENENQKFYEKKIAFRNGQIEAIIPNNLKAGKYLLTIQYDGNKYYSETSYKNYFTISKRIINCTFDDYSWQAYPDEYIELGATFIDQLNNKSIKNTYITYTFAGSTQITKTNNDGYAILRMTIPSVKQCLNGIAYHTLTVEINNSTYILEDVEKRISIIKYKTYIDIINAVREELNYLKINGNVVNENGENVKCGEISVSIDEADIHENINIIDGIFDDTIKLFELENFNEDLISDVSFSETTSSNTITTLTIDNDEVFIGDHINFEANVIEEGNRKPVDGMVTFIIKKDKKEIYRYVTELNNEGLAFFTFNVSTLGEYKVQVLYHESFFFNQSESEVQIYKVIEE